MHEWQQSDSFAQRLEGTVVHNEQLCGGLFNRHEIPRTVGVFVTDLRLICHF